ncbi:16242_t:CDS:2, partial [Racocetra persica]
MNIDYINTSNTNSNVQEILFSVSSSDINLIVDEIESTNSQTTKKIQVFLNTKSDQDKGQIDENEVYEDDEDSNSDFK